MEKQKLINRAVNCLYLGAAIYVVVALRNVYVLFDPLNANEELAKFAPHVFGTLVLPLAIVIVSAIIAKELKKENAVAWAASLGMFFLMMFGWAFPVAIFGMLSLLDSRIRGELFEKLDIKI